MSIFPDWLYINNEECTNFDFLFVESISAAIETQELLLDITENNLAIDFIEPTIDLVLEQDDLTLEVN